MNHIEAVQQLIDIILDAKDKISAINELPDPYRIRAERTLSILANGSAHSIGAPLVIGDNVAEILDLPPISNFLGREISVLKEEQIMDSEITESDFELFASKIKEIREVMPTFTPKQFYDNYSETEIRGVARLLKLNVTSTDPEVITMDIINEMYAALEASAASDEITAASNEAKLNHQQKTSKPVPKKSSRR